MDTTTNQVISRSLVCVWVTGIAFPPNWTTLPHGQHMYIWSPASWKSGQPSTMRLCHTLDNHPDNHPLAGQKHIKLPALTSVGILGNDYYWIDGKGSIAATGSVSNEPGSVTWLATKYLKNLCCQLEISLCKIEIHCDPFYLHEQRLGWRIPDQTMVTCVWLMEEWCLQVIQRRANNMDACPLVLKGISFSKPPDVNFVITLGMVSTDEDCTMIQCQWRHQMETFSALLANDAELQCFLWFAPEPTVEQTMETQVIWDATALIMTSLQCFLYNVTPHLRVYHVIRGVVWWTTWWSADKYGCNFDILNHWKLFK